MKSDKGVELYKGRERGEGEVTILEKVSFGGGVEGGGAPGAEGEEAIVTDERNCRLRGRGAVREEG